MSCCIRWNPRVRRYICFLNVYFKSNLLFLLLITLYCIDMIKTTIFEPHYILFNVLLCVIYVESPLPHITHSMKSQGLTFLVPITILNMLTCSCELCTCLYILYKWVSYKIVFSYIYYNLIASFFIGCTLFFQHAKPPHLKYVYFPTHIKFLITSIQFLWADKCLSNKIYILPHPFFPISLYDLLFTFSG